MPEGKLRGVGKKLLIRFALGFDLALPSDFLGGFRSRALALTALFKPRFFCFFENSVSQAHLKVTG